MPNLKVLSNLFRRYAHDSVLLAGEIDNIENDASSFTTPDLIHKASRSAYNTVKADTGADADLPDGAHRGSDMWATKDPHGTRERHQTGPMESASGSGATKMVSDYGEPIEQNEMVKVLAQLSEQLCETNKRVANTEKALASIAAFIGKASDAKFPESETEDRDDDEDADSDDDENEVAEKSHFAGKPRTASIPQFLDRLASRSRHNPVPPSFIKSGRFARSFQDVLRTEGHTLTTAESIAAKSYVQRLEMRSRGIISAANVGRPPKAAEALILKSVEGAALLRN